MTTDAVTLDEVLEQMLPLCDANPFEVARWLNDHIELGKIRLLADGTVVPPYLYPTHLVAVARVAADRRATLRIELRRSFGLGNEGEEQPIKQWAVERKSFETNRPDAARNRGGRPPKYNRERLLIEALIYSAVNGWPDTLDGEGGLFEKLGDRLKKSAVPERTTLYDIFTPIHDRIEDERNKSKKKRVR